MTAGDSMPPIGTGGRPGSARAEGKTLAVAHASNYQHLAFETVRHQGHGSADEGKCDKLRAKLVDVGHRFVGFDRTVEDDTLKRKDQEKQRVVTAQDSLLKLEKAMNCEIKRRIDANKQVQSLSDTLANDMLERLQSDILVRIERLAASIETMTLRASALEKGIAQFRGELPSKLQVDTAALVKEISELRRQMEGDRQGRIERDTALLRRIAELESTEAVQFEQGVAKMQRDFDQLKAEINSCARDTDAAASLASRTEKFRVFILEEIAGMKNTLATTSRAREQTDDEIVQAMNQYTNAMHKGLHSANYRP